MPQKGVSRRAVLRTASSAATAMGAASYSRVLGANNRPQLGVIGCGGRGVYVMNTFIKTDQVEVRSVCDVWPERTAKAKETAINATVFNDHRKLLDGGKDLDAVLIATPDHWHADITIEALNAGKDVYVEKPLTLKIEEGPKIVKAARVNSRICQVGMQQRSGKIYLQAKEEIVKAGKLGKVTLARTWWHGNGAHLQKAPARMATRPSDLDWARFLGPVKWRDWDPQQYWNFRAYLDFGGGQVTDLFTHWIDVVHMFQEQDDPISASAAGGVYHYKDGRTAPDTINVLLEYPRDWTATFEATLAPGITGAAVELCGTEGRLNITRARYEYYSKDKNAPPVVVKSERDQTIDHVENFLDCIRSRKLPNGDVWIGHRSAQASHLGNIAYEQKRRLRFDPAREEILPL
ncbi:MAG TPA: Gfo/Idh/MocA family oxidoreductase [Bryobacteraceae bacterium]|nr:Gfo/Idh/MocA family oxidoreductase [Bryobacteraceae bacterium]